LIGKVDRSEVVAGGGQAAKAAVLTGALVGSAYLMTVALQSDSGRWLGWVTLLPVFLAIQVLSPARALLAGALWGFSVCFFSARAEGVGLATSLRSYALLTAIPALYAFAGARVTRKVGFSPLLLGLGWVGVEIALKPLALHNGLLAGTQDGGLFIQTIGNVAGWALVAFLVAYVNASLLSMLTVVCASAPRSPYLRGIGGAAARLFFLEGRVYVAHVVSEARPRAPPF